MEKLLLYKLALSLPHNCTVVEIGSYLGASSSFLASAAKEKDGILYCVDTWKNEGMDEAPRDTYEEFIQNTKHYENWIIPMRGKSVEVAKDFNIDIDMLFIDGDHSYQAVKADVDAWFPKLKNGAIVVFHDCGWAEGVQKVIEEIVKSMQIGKGNALPNIYWARIRNHEF